MTDPTYFAPKGGLPSQSQLHTGRAVFTDAYAVIPRGCMADIVTSNLPHWDQTRAWILARPLSGFAETFAQYIVDVAPGGGSTAPEPDADAQAVLFGVSGNLTLTIDGKAHSVGEGDYAYIPAGSDWQAGNDGDENATFHWFRKQYQVVDGIDRPEAFVVNERDITPNDMAGTDGRWSTTCFVDRDDLRHDMQVNIVNLEAGATIPFEETHVMEHGIYVLEGKAVYRLNQDWVEVEAGDFMWLRAFCPQACYAAGPGRFRYLLYKDVNRHPALSLK